MVIASGQLQYPFYARMNPAPLEEEQDPKPPPLLELGYRGGTDHFMFDNAKRSTHKSLFRWIAIMLSLVGSMTCIGFGVSLYCRALVNPRAEAVGQYNNAVQLWTEAERQPFDSLDVSVRVGNSTHPLEPDGEEDVLADAVTQDLSPFRPLKYSRYGPLLPQMSWDRSVGERRVDLTLELHDRSTGTNSAIRIDQVEFYRTLIHQRKNQKTCLYQTKGYWNMALGHCETYERVDKLCFTVKRHEETNEWRLGAESEHSGCFGLDEVKRPQHFVKVAGATQGFGVGSPPEGRVDFDQLHTTVRSVHDPTLEADKVTRGTLMFGSTQRDDFLQGFMFGALGVLLGLPMAGLCMITYNEPKDEYQAERALQAGSGPSKSTLGQFWSSLSANVSATPTVADDFEGL